MSKYRATFYGKIQSGVLVLNEPELASKFCNTLPDDMPIELIIKKQSKSKTANQLAYYFGCIVDPMAKESGYTKQEMDGILCQRFLTQNCGTSKQYVKSKEDLDTTEFAELIDHAICFAAMEFGLVIEPPDPNWKDKK